MIDWFIVILMVICLGCIFMLNRALKNMTKAALINEEHIRACHNEIAIKGRTIDALTAEIAADSDIIATLLAEKNALEDRLQSTPSGK